MSKTAPTTQPSPTRHTPGRLTVIRVPVREGALQHEDAMDRNTIAFFGMVLDGTQYDRLYLAAEQAHPDECFAMEENTARLALCWNTHDDLLACAKSNVLDMLEILTGVNGLDGESAEIARLKSLIEGRIAATESTVAAATGGGTNV